MALHKKSIIPLYVNGHDPMDVWILKRPLIPISFPRPNPRVRESAVQPSMYSRKVFLGGIPTHCSDLELMRVFSPFGKFTVSRPNPGNALRSKNYCFLVFERSNSVDLMLDAVEQADGAYFAYLWGGTRMTKVQIRPFNIFDSKFTTTPNCSVNLRFAVFVGGISRTSRAVELARAFCSFGQVVGVTIDLDPELLYPRGTARVFFASMDGYSKAMRQRMVNVPFEDEHKTYEIKPFILDSPCEECYSRSVVAVKAKHFCASASCLSYYCDGCWNHVHHCGPASRLRVNHQPFNKGHQGSSTGSPSQLRTPVDHSPPQYPTQVFAAHHSSMFSFVQPKSPLAVWPWGATLSHPPPFRPF